MKRHAGSGAFGREWVSHAVSGLAILTLLVALFRLQILGTGQWELRAESNRIRQLAVTAARGDIVDRDGRVIATSAPGYALVVLPSGLASLETTLRHIGTYVDLPESEIQRHVDAAQRYGNQPVVVDSDADFETVSAIEERIDEFPEVFVETRPRRRYPAGAVAGHLTGYVAGVSPEELEGDEFRGYARDAVVGKTGLERQYEALLQGSTGYRYVEIDAGGRIVGEYATSRQEPGTPGQTLSLNIHLGLQQRIAELFPDTLSGAVVALDVEDGGVLALYSAPSYDPNAFVGGIDETSWELLASDPAQPLFHRAVLGLYPPASTWKLAVAAIGIDLGLVTIDGHMPVPCTGAITISDDRRRCWDASGHGFNTLAEAIGNSCNVYFYQLGITIGLDRLIERANEIGFRDKCGIDLPAENEGVFPESRAYWERAFGYEARENEVLSLAIGQGPNSQTPLKIAQFYLALARDGSAPPPALAQGVELGEGRVLKMDGEDLAAIREGLGKATAPGGTAHFETALEHWEVWGKTGTGQNPLSVRGEAPDHAWFAGMAGPIGGPPEIAVAVIVEYGANGSTVAAPIMAKAADYYLRVKHGIPVDSLQTYRDYLNAGVHPAWYWNPSRQAAWDGN